MEYGIMFKYFMKQKNILETWLIWNNSALNRLVAKILVMCFAIFSFTFSKRFMNQTISFNNNKLIKPTNECIKIKQKPSTVLGMFDGKSSIPPSQ